MYLTRVEARAPRGEGHTETDDPCSCILPLVFKSITQCLPALVPVYILARLRVLSLCFILLFRSPILFNNLLLFLFHLFSFTSIKRSSFSPVQLANESSCRNEAIGIQTAVPCTAATALFSCFRGWCTMYPHTVVYILMGAENNGKFLTRIPRCHCIQEGGGG